MKMKAVFVMALLLLVSVTSATIDGDITNVDWPLSGTMLNPVVTIKNTGDEVARFHVMITVSDGNGKKYSSSCSVTSEIGVGETSTMWPYSLKLEDRGDMCCVAVELYSDSCLKSKLLDVEKRR